MSVAGCLHSPDGSMPVRPPSLRADPSLRVGARFADVHTQPFQLWAADPPRVLDMELSLAQQGVGPSVRSVDLVLIFPHIKVRGGRAEGLG